MKNIIIGFYAVAGFAAVTEIIKKYGNYDVFDIMNDKRLTILNELCYKDDSTNIIPNKLSYFFASLSVYINKNNLIIIVIIHTTTSHIEKV